MEVSTSWVPLPHPQATPPRLPLDQPQLALLLGAEGIQSLLVLHREYGNRTLICNPCRRYALIHYLEPVSRVVVGEPMSRVSRLLAPAVRAEPLAPEPLPRVHQSEGMRDEGFRVEGFRGFRV